MRAHPGEPTTGPARAREGPGAGPGEEPGADPEPAAPGAGQRDAGPAFSVLVATFQRDDVVGRAVASVLAQTIPDFEVIVVDDGSTDRTVEVLGAFTDPRLRLVVLPVNRGTSAAWNAGLAVAQGRYVVLLGSDDELMPTALETMAAAWSAEEDPAVGQQVFRVVDADSRQVIGALEGDGVTLDYLDLLCGRRSFGGDFCGAHRREALPSSAFDADLRGFEQLAWLRMRQRWTGRIHQEVVYLAHRDRPGQRLSRIDSRIARAGTLAEGNRRILAEHGDAMARHCRAMLWSTVGRAVVYSVLAGDRRAALRTWAHATRRHGLSVRSALLPWVIVAGRLPVTAVLRAYDRVKAR